MENPSARPAVLYADIYQYQKLAREDKARALHLLSRLESMTRDAAGRYDGVFLKGIGDGVLARFPFYEGAVDTALSLQAFLEAEGAYARVGLCVADSDQSMESREGADIDRAAQLEALATPGAVAVFSDEVPKGGEARRSRPGPSLKLKGEKKRRVTLLFASQASRRRSYRGKFLLRLWRWGSLALGVGLFAALLYAGFSWKALWQDFLFNRQWKSWTAHSFDEDENLAESLKGWAPSMIAEVGSINLNSDQLVYTLASIDQQPFVLRARIRVADPSREARVEIVAVTGLGSKTREAIFAGAPGGTDWTGVFGDLSLGSSSLSIRTGTRDAKGLAHDVGLGALDATPEAKSHEFELSYSGDMLETRVNGVLAAHVFLRGLPGAGRQGLRFGLNGSNVTVDSFEVFVPRAQEQLNLLTAADDYRVSGKPDLARQIYEDLAEKTQDPEEKSRYLLKRALAQGEAGDLIGKQSTEREILAMGLKNNYVSIAAYDLAEPMVVSAMNLLAKGKMIESMRGSIEALEILKPLAEGDYGDAARPQGRMAYLRLMAGPYGRISHAEELAKSIIETRNDPYAAEALEFYAREIKAPEWGAKDSALAYFDSIIAKGRTEVGALYNSLLLRRLERLEALKLEERYVEALSEFWTDRYVSRAIRYEVYTSLAKTSFLPAFRVALRAWVDKAKASSPIEFAKACRDYVTLMGVPIFGGREEFIRQSPMAELAFDVLTTVVTFREAEPGAETLEPREFLTQPDLRVSSWGAEAQKQPQQDGNQTWVWKFASGKSYGGGLAFNAGKDSINLLGYRAIDIELRAPEGVRWLLTLSESGVGALSAESYAGKRRADGEAYHMMVQRAVGEWQTVRLLFGDLRPHPYWGNQDGNLIFDTQSLANLDFYILGGQGSGQLRIRSIKFVP